MIFPEAITELAMYRRFADAVKVPILANITEFGATPLFTARRTARRRRRDRALSAVGVPRDEQGGAQRLRRRCAATARRRAVVDTMQTRAELYDYLGYHAYEQKLDALFAQEPARTPARSRRSPMNDVTRRRRKPKKSVALSGVTAGNTALCTVGRTGNDLHYRGYDILDIAETCEFEEIAYLLVHGKLPTRAELAALQAQARSRCAALPAAVQGRCSSRFPPPRIRWT